MSITYWCMMLSVMLISLLILRKTGTISRRIIVGLWMFYLLRIAIPMKIPTKISVYNWIDPLLEISEHPVKQMTVFHSNNGVLSVPKSASIFYEYYLVAQMAGILISIVCVAVLLLRCRVVLKSANLIHSQLLDDWLMKNHAEFYGKVQVRTSANFATVMSCGGFRKFYILLPRDFVFDESSSSIIEHEVAHLRHHDSIVKLVALFIAFVNWFNPFVWTGFFFLCQDIEIACDEFVLMKNNRDFRRKYANLLIDCVAEALPNNLFISYRSRKNLRERIVRIMKYKPKSTVKNIFSLIVSMGIFLSLSTNLIAIPISEKYCVAVPEEVVRSYAFQDNLASCIGPKISYLSSRTDGSIDPHSVDTNGDKFFYDKAGDPWNFSINQKVTISIRMLDRQFPYGQGIEIGYLFNGNESCILSDQIHSGLDLDFIVPASGTYLFYVECLSSDPLNILKMTIV